jgi:hypothetical protein
MTDQNLHVVTDHIDRLAAMQHTAADKIMGSNRTTADVAGNVLSTHGLVCSATSIALSSADAARKAAGEVLYKVSTEFEAKLTTAAVNYADTDYRLGDSLGQACEV